ncbi:hypothetical protein BOX15_Mlig029760g1, partial [Macrostomum lignano]
AEQFQSAGPGQGPAGCPRVGLSRQQSARGSNSRGETFLASMPTKFRRHVWIKRGDFVLTEPIAEGVRVRAEIAAVLLNDQIDYLVRNGAWPEAFLPDLAGRQGLARLAAAAASDDAASAESCGGVPADMLPPTSDTESEDDLDAGVNPDA